MSRVTRVPELLSLPTHKMEIFSFSCSPSLSKLYSNTYRPCPWLSFMSVPVIGMVSMFDCGLQTYCIQNRLQEYYIYV
jgi:hypothetical protein